MDLGSWAVAGFAAERSHRDRTKPPFWVVLCLAWFESDSSHRQKIDRESLGSRNKLPLTFVITKVECSFAVFVGV